MNIVYEDGERVTKFNGLDVGDVFEIIGEDKNTVYMKMDCLLDSVYNAIDLGTGVTDCIGEKCPVRKLTATLHVERG